MKRILIIIIIFVTNCHVMFSQETLSVFFVDAVTKSVPVYANDSDTKSFTNIRESKEKENWNDVEILDQSNNRYKVCITPYSDENATPINGWVDKEQCGVLLFGKYIDKNLTVVSLYLTPDQPYPFLKITDQYADDFRKYTNDKAVPVLDYKFYNEKYWIKTVIYKDKKKIIGWTTDYCPNIYGACN